MRTRITDRFSVPGRGYANLNFESTDKKNSARAVAAQSVYTVLEIFKSDMDVSVRILKV
jgi:hypothetical protein